MCFGRTIRIQNSRKLAYRNIQTKKLLRGITGGRWRRFRLVDKYMEGIKFDIL